MTHDPLELVAGRATIPADPRRALMPKHDVEQRFGQFSLRFLFGLTTLVAIYLSVAKCCGHLSAVMATVALLLLTISETSKWSKGHVTARVTFALLAGCSLWLRFATELTRSMTVGSVSTPFAQGLIAQSGSRWGQRGNLFAG